MQRLYPDGVCVNLQVSCPEDLKNEIVALANSHGVSVGVFLVPHLRRLVAHEHQPHDQVHLSVLNIEAEDHA